jgi:hypothetical protein
MGAGLSSEKMQKQESFVRQNLAKEKSRISFIKNVDGSSRYSDEQIKMKLRQDYNSNGYTKHRNDRDAYIPYSHWNTGR